MSALLQSQSFEVEAAAWRTGCSSQAATWIQTIRWFATSLRIWYHTGAVVLEVVKVCVTQPIFLSHQLKKKEYQSLSSCIMRTCTERVELTQQYDTANDGERCDVSTKRQNRHLNIFRAQNLKETKTICNTDIFTGKQDTQNQKQLAEDQQRKLFFFFFCPFTFP